MKIFSLCGLGLLAAGCVETTAQQVPAQAPRQSNMARLEGVSPRGATVAVVDVQGLSDSVSQRLSQAFEQQARGRDINLVPLKTANYLVRGYVDTSPVEGGASFAVVWDVYDGKKRRMQRIDDQVVVKGAQASLENIDDHALNLIAATSADDLAAVLSNMPEAIAAASSPASKAVAVARTRDVDTTTRVAGTPPAVAASVPQDTGIGMASALR